jgi:hypothetical protein
MRNGSRKGPVLRRRALSFSCGKCDGAWRIFPRETASAFFLLSVELRALELPHMSGSDDKNDDDLGGTGQNGTGVVTKTRPKTKKPSLYKVLILNDDYTPMEFVVHILERFFNKNREEAVQIMLHVHRHGVGILLLLHGAL